MIKSISRLEMPEEGSQGTLAAARVVTPAQYGDLAEVPPELEWLANITNPKTREAYGIDVQEFSTFAGLGGHAEFRTVTPAHVIAWRKHLEVRPGRFHHSPQALGLVQLPLRA
jgi:hypothetical protein